MRDFAPTSPPHEYLETRIVRLTKIVDFHTGLELYDSDNGPIGAAGAGGVSLAQVNTAIAAALATHTADADPHAVYLTEAEADLLYAKLPAPNPRRQELITVATDGQTVFTLAQAPTQPTEVMMAFRRVPRRLGVDFTVVGTMLTFTMADVEAYADDQLQVWYE